MKRKQLIKTIALALVIVSASSITPFKGQEGSLIVQQEASATETKTGQVIINNVKYTLYQTYAEVQAGTGASYPGNYGATGDIAIESTVNGLPVTRIGTYAFASSSEMTSINIPSSVTQIGYGAFFYCSSLKKVTLSEGLKVIEDSAFYGNNSLDKLVIPSTVDTIMTADVFSFSNIKYMAIANGATVSGINYQRNFALDVLFFKSIPTYNSGNKEIKTDVLIISKTDTKTPVHTIYSKLYYAEYIKTVDNSLIDTESGDFIYFVRPDNETVTYLDISDIKGNILPNALRLGTDLKIIKAPKTWVDTQTTKPRVYFYDSDGAECLASYSVVSGTSLVAEAAKIGTKWTKDSGSVLGNITQDSTFMLAGELVKPEPTKLEAPTLTPSKTQATNREEGITITIE